VIHVRVVSPTATTEQVVALLSANSGVMNLIVAREAAINPDGDAVHFDVITAEANPVLRGLRALEVDRHGSIVVENVDFEISNRAAAAENREPTIENLAPIWESAEATIRGLGHYAPSWFTLMVIAALIATVGILTNSQILIVGAMVVGPEYGAIINVGFGLHKRTRPPVVAGMRALIFGFGAAIIACLLFSLVIRAFDLQPAAYSNGIRPVSDLIDEPNVFSIIVAVLAGVVGVVSLTEARANTLIGVFVSVTTIPAAADIGLSGAFGSWSEARGSAVQLLLNVGILIAVGVVGLKVQQRLWSRVRARLPRR
jgi:uncharacterized hydrophobic protein (TIGR00271 family)